MKKILIVMKKIGMMIVVMLWSILKFVWRKARKKVSTLWLKAKRTRRHLHSVNRAIDMDSLKTWRDMELRCEREIEGQFFTWLLWGICLLFSIIMLFKPNWFHSLMTYWQSLKYFILLVLGAGMTYFSRQLEQDKTSGWFSTTVYCNIFLLSLVPLAGILFYTVSVTVDFWLMVIAVSFVVLPTFYLTLAMLNIVKSRLLRMLVATISVMIVVGYSFLIFGTYGITKYEEAKTYNEKQLLEYSCYAVNYGFESINIKSLTKVKEGDYEALAPIFLGSYGAAILTCIGATAAKENTRCNAKQTKNKRYRKNLDRRKRFSYN